MLYSASLMVLAALSAHAAAPPVWQLPTSRLHYNSAVSFRGLEEGRVPGYDVAGHAATLPGVTDFLRLVPSTPLAHGALFTHVPLAAHEWIVEVAFRIHGPEISGLVESDAEGTLKKGGMHKGGRGLAFWATKEGLPGPVTVSSNAGKVSSPPPLSPQVPSDPTDPLVSLFGSRTSFDGLGVVFDSEPNSPLLRRSDPRNTDEHAQHQTGGVGATGVVSGIMDDATGGMGGGKWLDKEGRVMKSGEEAAYLEKAIGECEAAFRNAQGLLWARIAHVNETIRVDLDLSPHTTLSKAGRHYEHNCFTLEGVKLANNMYLGVTGLASGNTEPDSVDIYAMDVFEILNDKEVAQNEAAHGGVLDTEEPVEKPASEPLEGTSEEGIPTLTHEIFLSQARMVEAIDALARKIESMSNTLSQLARSGGLARGAPVVPAPPSGGSGSGGEASEYRLAAIDRQLGDMTAMLGALRTENAAKGSEGESLTHLLQLQDRLMEEVKGLGRKVDSAQGQSAASISTISLRTSELLGLLKSTATFLEQQYASSGLFSGVLGKVFYALVGVAVGIVFAAWRQKQRDDPWSGGSKKYF
ncbi:hypothetical protein JCM10207_009125 [Rhodosporidiobolus poonsookiae]